MSEDRPRRRGALAGLIGLLALEGPLVIAAAVSATLAAALALVPFFVVARMATAIHDTPARLGDVPSLAFAAVLALLLRTMFAAGSTMLVHVAAFRILHALRIGLAAKLGAVPLSFFGRRSTGELEKTFMDDVDQVEAFAAHHAPDAVAAAVVPIATAIALVWVDWRMALVSAAAAPLAIGAMAIARRDAGAAARERMDASLLEYLRGIQVIETFGLSAARFGELARSIQESLARMERSLRANGRGHGAFGALIGSSLVLLVPAGGWFYLHGTLGLESLLLFLVLGPQLLLSMLRLLFAWGHVERIAEGSARIRAILDGPEVAGGTAEPAHHGIAFRRVGLRRGEGGPEILRDVSFAAPAGKVTALVGPSGAGTTALIRLVPRLWEATTGSVELGGVDVRELAPDQLLGRVAMVFQDLFLFDGTVRENLRLGRAEASDQEIEEACRAACAHDFIRALPDGYDSLIGERSGRLSSGEAQRLSIARALLRDAPVLLLDEAIAFADPESEARIQEGLSALCAGRTVLVAAHRLSTIAGADHIVVLDRGRVVGQGTHDELLARCELYRRMWRDQADALDWSLGEPPAPVASAVVAS